LWHLPPVPESFTSGELTFTFEGAEADFLYERIVSSSGATYLSWLLDQPLAENTLLPWDHPSVARAPSRIQDALALAQYFAEVERGPALVYNLLVARVAGRRELVSEYRERVKEWATRIDREFPSMPADLTEFWTLVSGTSGRISPDTRAFIDWTLLMTSKERHGLADNVDAHARLAARERRLKGAMARLTSKRSLDTWNGASGLQMLDYRWTSVQPMVRDIVNGRSGA
jgi:hypothetical protein